MSSNTRWGKTPEKEAAHVAVHDAVKRGDLTIPDACEYCGIKRRTFAHHADYRAPLAVVWPCARCHRLLHGMYPDLPRVFAEAAR